MSPTTSRRYFSPSLYGSPLSKYIRHYEGLSYDTEALHNKHQRAKRALSHEDKFVHLEFHAHGRILSQKRHAVCDAVCCVLWDGDQ
ncbi:hypothetical protein JZ751_018196, partial [Albula glossodonta]